MQAWPWHWHKLVDADAGAADGPSWSRVCVWAWCPIMKRLYIPENETIQGRCVTDWYTMIKPESAHNQVYRSGKYVQGLLVTGFGEISKSLVSNEWRRNE